MTAIATQSVTQNMQIFRRNRKKSKPQDTEAVKAAKNTTNQPMGHAGVQKHTKTKNKVEADNAAVLLLT